MTSSILEMKTDIEYPETGVESAKSLAASVAACLADTYLLMIKTQGYHWNVVGPLFHSVHVLTEEQYTDMFKAIDEIAERVRALGYPAPSSVAEMVAVSGISEDTGNASTEEMIGNLIADHEAAARRFRDAVALAEKKRDVVTADMLTARIGFHEKSVWMLKALLTS